ncbi:hypothetical protein Pelo_5194 [Pelomyxa schiedti]|nr:hypothetical protein Pelo_5194 [Pelomyxa schiedti]
MSAHHHEPILVTPFEGWFCDICRARPGPTAPRFRCPTCSDYDQCQGCHSDAAKAARHPHETLLVPCTGNEGRWFCVACLAAFSVLSGSGAHRPRYRCYGCGADLCGSCYASRREREHRVVPTMADVPWKHQHQLKMVTSPSFWFCNSCHTHGNASSDRWSKVLKILSAHQQVQMELGTAVFAVLKILLEADQAKPAPPPNCLVCEENPACQPLNLTCGHRLCQPCFLQYLQVALETGAFPCRCPECKTGAPAATGMDLYQSYIEPTVVISFCEDSANNMLNWGRDNPKNFAVRFNAQQLPAMIQQAPGTQNMRCSCPKCLSAIIGSEGPDVEPRVRCVNPTCATLFCRVCKVGWHFGSTCQQLQERAAQAAGRDEATQELLRRTTKRCPGCGAGITHFKDHGTFATAASATGPALAAHCFAPETVGVQCAQTAPQATVVQSVLAAKGVDNDP